MPRQQEPSPGDDRSEAIALPFSPDSVRQVLQWGLASDAPYTHEDIATWCERFWSKYMDRDAPHEIERVLPFLAEVDAQWDLHLANTYTFEELIVLDLSQVRLPKAWFVDWLRTLDA